MKTIFILIAMVLLISGRVSGDEKIALQPEMTETQLKTEAREMIQAGMDKDESINMNRLMLKNRFTLEQRISARKIVMQAYQEGLPPEPIMNKAYEGMAKQADQENIIQAMEKVRARYAFAYQQAKGTSDKESQRTQVMEQIQKCVAAGMAENDVERITYQLRYRVRELPKEDTDGLAAETFRMAKEMVRQRVRSMQAAEVVREALDNNYGAKEMIRIRHSFRKHSKEASAHRVAKAYLECLQTKNRVENLNFKDGKIKGTSTGGSGQAGGGITGNTGNGSQGSGGSAGAGKGSGSSKGRRR